MSDSAKQDIPVGDSATAEAPAQTRPGADADAGSTASADGAASANGANEATPDLDEVKRKFRAALDRKREVHAEGSGKGGRDAGKINDAHGPARNRRSFRRKSG
jgi:hypothetical protein